MKTSMQLCAALICGLILVGCGKEQPAPEPQVKKPATPSANAVPELKATAQEPAPPPPTTAAAPAASSAPQATAPEEVKQDVLTTVLHATQSFMINKERPPKDLQELVQTGYLKSMPVAPAGKKLVFDPSRGTIKLENQ